MPEVLEIPLDGSESASTMKDRLKTLQNVGAIALTSYKGHGVFSIVIDGLDADAMRRVFEKGISTIEAHMLQDVPSAAA